MAEFDEWDVMELAVAVDTFWLTLNDCGKDYCRYCYCDQWTRYTPLVQVVEERHHDDCPVTIARAVMTGYDDVVREIREESY